MTTTTKALTPDDVITKIEEIQKGTVEYQRFKLAELRQDTEVMLLILENPALAQALVAADKGAQETPQEKADHIAWQIADWWWTEGVDQSDEIARYDDPCKKVTLELTDGDYDYIAQQWERLYGVPTRSNRNDGQRHNGYNVDRKYNIGKTAAAYFRGFVSKAASEEE